MAKLNAAFRRTIKLLAERNGWRVTDNKPLSLWAERRPSGETLQQISLSPQEVWAAEEEPLRTAALTWTYVVFERLEERIVELLRDAGHNSAVTDARTASFPLSSLILPGDPQCLTGYVLNGSMADEDQALEFWDFYWSRAKSVLDQLSSPTVLRDIYYVPPFTARTKWATRQLLWHGLRGDFGTANRIAAGIEKTANLDLTSSVKALETAAVDKGHNFIMNARALDYRSHPSWLEFVAVRDHVAKIS